MKKIWSKCTENVNKNNGIHSTFIKSLNLDGSLLKTKSKKYFQFYIPRKTNFLVIPVSDLYDENIDRPKLSEHKKTHLSI